MLRRRGRYSQDRAAAVVLLRRGGREHGADPLRALAAAHGLARVGAQHDGDEQQVAPLVAAELQGKGGWGGQG